MLSAPTHLKQWVYSAAKLAAWARSDRSTAVKGGVPVFLHFGDTAENISYPHGFLFFAHVAVIK